MAGVHRFTDNLLSRNNSPNYLTLQPSHVTTPKWIPFPTSEQMTHICWPSVISTCTGLTVHTTHKIHIMWWQHISLYVSMN